MFTLIIRTLISIYKAITGIFSFIVNLITETAAIVRFLGSAIAAIPSYLDFFPPAFGAALIALLTVAIVYKITGREG